MAKWIEYTGSDEQFEELASAKTIVRVRYANRQEVNRSCRLFKCERDAKDILQDAIAYLICQPHPYADIIKTWADTGCMIHVREPIDYAMTGYMYKDYATDQPNWNIPNAIFRLTPFED